MDLSPEFRELGGDVYWKYCKDVFQNKVTLQAGDRVAASDYMSKESLLEMVDKVQDKTPAELKAMGNLAVQQAHVGERGNGNIIRAIMLYTVAIHKVLSPSGILVVESPEAHIVAQCCSNRSLCNMRLGKPVFALVDGLLGFFADPMFLKVQMRIFAAAEELKFHEISAAFAENGYLTLGWLDAGFVQLVGAKFPPPPRAPVPNTVMGIRCKNHLMLTPVAIPLESEQLRVRLYESPVMEIVGIPIVIHVLHEPAKGDNQFATYLMINPEDGFADMRWRTGEVGDVIMFRKDRKPLSCPEGWGLWDYFCILLDYSAEERRSQISKEKFLEWEESYNMIMVQTEPESQVKFEF